VTQSGDYTHNPDIVATALNVTGDMAAAALVSRNQVIAQSEADAVSA
jgi:Na+/H+-dicarboxylate symporter